MNIRRWILHIDMDSFFVSVERILNPSLIGKPVIVGGDPKKRGVVSSASYEARSYGVHSAMPMAQAIRLCPQAVLITDFSGRYGEFSHKIKKIFERFSPLVEMASLDEAYIDLSGTERLFGHPLKVAEKIHNTIKNELGLPSSGGLGVNKLVSKIASGMAKPNGLLWILPGHEPEFLSHLPLKKMPGIGDKCFEKLSRFGLKTIGDLHALGEWHLENIFGDTGKFLYKRSIGFDNSQVIRSREAKSVGREYTFEQDTCVEEVFKTTLCYLAEKVGWGLRNINVKARTITLKLRYSDFKTITRSKTIHSPTNNDSEIFKTAFDLFSKVYTRRVRIRLLGLSASNFYSCYQYDFFDEISQRRFSSLYSAIDKIKDKHGFESIHKAQSIDFITKK